MGHVLLSPEDIKGILERPTKLKPCATADEYEMERYMNVATEAAKAIAGRACPPETHCLYSGMACRECWLSWIDKQRAVV